MEEAANVAAEYIASLDNLQNEVAFLLAEIKYKDQRSQELLDSINKDTGRYLRHSLRSANPNSYTPTPNGGGSSSSSGFTAKDETIPEKVQQDFIEVDRLAEEKIKLAARLNRLLARARARLDHDLKKVLILQGDLDPNQAPPTLSMASSFTPGLSAAASIGVGAIGVGGAGAGVGAIPVSVGNGGMGGAVASGLSTGGVHGTIRNPVQMMNDSLRNALAGAAVLSEQPQPQHQHTITSIPAATASNKRVRKAASAVTIPSIKLPSPAPTTIHVPQRHAPPAPSVTTHRPSPGRPSRQQQQKVPTPVPMSVEGGDEDAEGEDDVEGIDDADVDDDRIYCTCRRTSFGEMVACDNPHCPYEWFHLPCVNLKPPLPESWYCAECVHSGAAPTGVTPVGSGAGIDTPSNAGGGSERSRKRKR